MLGEHVDLPIGCELEGSSEIDLDHLSSIRGQRDPTE
jgi:hypothetical protein